MRYAEREPSSLVAGRCDESLKGHYLRAYFGTLSDLTLTDGPLSANEQVVIALAD